MCNTAVEFGEKSETVRVAAASQEKGGMGREACVADVVSRVGTRGMICTT